MAEAESEVPPYDDRSSGRNERAEGPERMLRGEEPPKDTVQPESSASSGEGEMAPEGVGESINRRGEDVVKREGTEAGRETEGTKGQSDRPYGSSDERDKTGI